jgi:glucosamine-6-phosphate deaminase
MKIEVLDSAEEVAEKGAEIMWEAVHARPDAVLALPTGRTPILMYAALRRNVEDASCDFSRATAYAIDEFCGVSRTTPGTNSAFYEEHVRIGLKDLRCPDPAAADPRAHIRDFASEIRRRGGIDLCVLGIGANGHIAFNEPGSERDSRARVVELAQTSRASHAATFGGFEHVPSRGMTLGIADLLEARSVLVLALGPHKAAAVHHAIEGERTPQLPASWLQDHDDVMWLLDREAADLLGE